MNDDAPINPVLSPSILAEKTVESWKKKQGKKLVEVFADKPKPHATGAVPKRTFKSPIKVVRDEPV